MIDKGFFIKIFGFKNNALFFIFNSLTCFKGSSTRSTPNSSLTISEISLVSKIDVTLTRSGKLFNKSSKIVIF